MLFINVKFFAFRNPSPSTFKICALPKVLQNISRLPPSYTAPFICSEVLYGYPTYFLVVEPLPPPPLLLQKRSFFTGQPPPLHHLNGGVILFLTTLSNRIIKLMDVLMIYLIRTFVQGFVFKTYTLLSTISVFVIVPLTIWSYIIPTSIVAIRLKSNFIICHVAGGFSILWGSYKYSIHILCI